LFGQTRKPRRAVLVMVDENGRVDGWEVFNATAGYELTGWPGGSAHGTITVSGEFHRMSRQLDLEELMP
jgi:hypothetical protein